MGGTRRVGGDGVRVMRAMMGEFRSQGTEGCMMEVDVTRQMFREQQALRTWQCQCFQFLANRLACFNYLFAIKHNQSETS